MQKSFPLLELPAAIAPFMHLPALSKAPAILCTTNTKQLQLGLLLYLWQH